MFLYPPVEESPPPLTTIGAILDALQTTDRTQLEHALLSASRLIFNESAQNSVLRRANELLESCSELFLTLFPRDGRVQLTTEISHLRLLSSIMDSLISSADFGPRISSKTIGTYIRAMLPVHRGPPPYYPEPDSPEALRKLTNYMSRHGELILAHPHSLLRNCLDRSHLYVALLRTATSMLSTKPSSTLSTFLLQQLDDLNRSFDIYLDRHYRQLNVPTTANCVMEYEQLNVDLILYEADRVAVAILHRDTTAEHFEPKISDLIEILQNLLNQLIRYCKYHGKAILEHFVLIGNREDAITFRYISGQLQAAAGDEPEGQYIHVAADRRLLGLHFGDHHHHHHYLGPVIDGLLPEGPGVVVGRFNRAQVLADAFLRDLEQGLGLGRGRRWRRMPEEEEEEEEEEDESIDNDQGVVDPSRMIVWQMLVSHHAHLVARYLEEPPAAAVPIRN